MNKALVLVTSLFLSVLSTQATAGVCWDCKIQSISSGSGAACNGTDSCVLIRVVKGVHAFVRPTCSTQPNWHFVLDTSTTSGKTLLTQLIVAQKTQEDFALIGSDTCSLSAGSEDLIRGYNNW